MTLRFAALIFSILLLSGCVYHPPFEQGNILSSSKIAKIKQGMMPDQVTAILGAPVLQNVYYNNQLIYVYEFKPSRGNITQKRVMITFSHNRVSDVRSSVSDT